MTTALIGFYNKNKYYVCCCDRNGEPSKLGKKIIEEIQNCEYEDWKEKFSRLEINPGDKVKFDDSLSIEGILNSGVLYNHVCDHLSKGFPHFQDYAYIINFDSDMFDFYKYTRVVQSYYYSHLPIW